MSNGGSSIINLFIYNIPKGPCNRVLDVGKGGSHHQPKFSYIQLLKISKKGRNKNKKEGKRKKKGSTIEHRLRH